MPFESQAQRGLAHAIAEGTVKDPPMSKATARKLIAEDTGGKLPKRLSRNLKRVKKKT